jgi:hypothetical protein
MNLFVIVSAAVFLLISVAYLPLLNDLYWSTLKSLTPPAGIVADLLVTNGTIFTSDSSLPFADSMAIRNGRILKVGSFATLKVLHFFYPPFQCSMWLMLLSYYFTGMNEAESLTLFWSHVICDFDEDRVL